MTHKKYLLLGALALFAFAAGCSSDECSTNADCADRGANFVCANSTCVQKTPVDSGTTCSPTCSGDTPICDQSSLTCVQCTQNSECSGATPACDTATNTCVACTSNAQCGGATPACDTGTNTCVACVGNGDCTDAAAPVCDTTAHACVACLTDANCTDASAPTCDTSTNTCVGCLSDTNCTDASAPVCDTTNQTCVGCLGNGDCGGSTPTCDTTSHTCTASCGVDTDCTDAAAPVCNTTTHLCVACDSTHACATGVCDTGTDTCVECLGSGDCASNPNGAACDTGTHTCGCAVAADCAATSGTPTCDTNAHACVAACGTDSDCSADLSSDCVDGGQGKLCSAVDVAAVSSAITTIKTTTLSGPITVTGAIVTYLKPSVSGDQAGFTVQAEKAGPALFVGIDTTTLSPVPAVGDRVSFDVTATSLSGNLVVATIDPATWDVISSGHDASLLKQDVSAVDLTSTLDADDSELISLTFTVAGNPSGANPGYLQAQIISAGVTTPSSNFKFYAPSTVFSDLNIVKDCTAQITNGILWRYNSAAEPAVWADAELTLTSCPFSLVSAAASDATHVVLTFDRAITGTPVAGDFTVVDTSNSNSALAVSAVAVNGDQVTLTTAAQTGGDTYQVTVGSAVKDDLGGSLDAGADTATFAGYLVPAGLLVNEINPNIGSSHDLVELLVTSAGWTGGFKLQQDIGNPTELAILPNVQVAVGDLIVVHLNPTGVTGIATASETTAKNEFPNASNAANYDNAWDFLATKADGTTLETAGITYSNRTVVLVSPVGTIVDAVPCAKAGTTTNASTFVPDVQTLIGQGLWDCGAEDCSAIAGAVAAAVHWENAGSSATTLSMHRYPAGQDTDSSADWTNVCNPADNTVCQSWGDANTF